MSTQSECQRRLTNLYKESHDWLLKASFNITHDTEESADMVAELYLYLSEKCNPKIFWGKDSYNLLYLHQFLKHRWYNKTPKLNKSVSFSSLTHEKDFKWIADEEYDLESDISMMKAYDDVIIELKALQTTKLWPKARIYELYWMSPDTLKEVANKIGISSSTTFIAIKRIRQHLANTIKNPFKI